MAKILLTGMTPTQAVPNFHLRQQLKVEPSVVGLKRALVQAGHTVTHRIVEPGEDLSEYDQALVYLSSFGSFANWFWPGALWTLHCFPDAAVGLDDWNIVQIISKTDGVGNFKVSRKWKELNWSHHVEKKHPSHIGLRESSLRESLDAVHTSFHKGRKMLLPAHKGGDLSKLFYPHRYAEFERVLSFFPEPFLDLRMPVEVEFSEKLKEWTTAGLSTDIREQARHSGIANQWPLQELGEKSGLRMEEQEAHNFYAQRWAHYLPSYKHQGSGWWRARPYALAFARSILVGASAEVKVLYGEDYESPTPAQIESASDLQLADWAVEQTERYFSRHPNRPWHTGYGSAVEEATQSIINALSL